MSGEGKAPLGIRVVQFEQRCHQADSGKQRIEAVFAAKIIRKANNVLCMATLLACPHTLSNFDTAQRLIETWTEHEIGISNSAAMVCLN